MQHQHVAVLDGGWEAWQQQGLPVEASTGLRETSATSFTARQGDVVLIDEVLEQECLVDSRDGARYRGEVEPIDKAAGHIPGAKNRCWKDNLNDDGHFKPAATLKHEFIELLGDTSSDEAAFYCGSGVTACHNLLAACHAGLDEPRLYAGSWSEWSAMPGRPVATGSE